MRDAFIFTVPTEKGGTRIDKFISEECERFSRSAAAKIIEEGGVCVNGTVISKN